LIVYDPRRQVAPHTETSIALNIDLAPTMLQLAGIDVPPTMQGRSLIPLLHGQRPADWRSDFLFEHLMTQVPTIRRSSGVIGGRYKYLRYLDPVPYYEQLFDMELDPYETNDLARDSAYAAILQSLRARHDELVAKAR
jgi:arylsulfatase A-like enzyme